MNEDRLTFKVEEEPPVGFYVGPAPEASFSIDCYAVIYDALPAYEGPVEVTPGGVSQVLLTTGKSLYSDIVVNPVPSNYGLITWDGTIITVS